MNAGTAAGTVAPATPAAARRRLRVSGLVQGVGFRPHVYRLAVDAGLSGLVGNDSAGVFVEIEGTPADLDAFAARLLAEQPPLARIDAIDTIDIAPTGESTFEIVASQQADGERTLVPPDVATCGDCLADIVDPTDRRYRYPFTNCTNCGPRFTIIRDLPYDRPATTMAGFEMCAACRAEYDDPTDRRYHAQPTACPACGPQLSFQAGDAPAAHGTDAVIAAVLGAIAAGGIVAIKGLGGYHLACDATNEAAVATLRHRKGRSDKPFAVMVADPATASLIANVDDAEASALASPARPIVLLRRRTPAPAAPAVSHGVAPGNPLIGVMLPYTPLHHLLFAQVPGCVTAAPRVLVLTSGNRSNEPICFGDAEARHRLSELADAFCTHDRPIEVPCDDSVVRIVDGELQPVRRSRGYAPIPIALPVEVAPVLGVGGELKNTCCVASGRRAWVGQHVGDMENLETLHAFDASVEAFTRMYRVEPRVFGADLHPAYLTRRWAAEQHGDIPLVGVQHHHAHVASVMAEHGFDGTAPVLGVAFDGTGYGTADDGTAQIWGGEVLLADYHGFRRIAHLAPLPLPGGDEGVRNPCRIAIAYLTALGLDRPADLAPVVACDASELAVVTRQVERRIGCVPTTSMGRLFDVVASLLDVRHRVSYEAQAAIELEALAEQGRPGGVDLTFGSVLDADRLELDPRPVLAALAAQAHLADQQTHADLALAFHVAVADAVVTVAEHARRRLGYDGPVALTGGVFQNTVLCRHTRAGLGAAGFQVITHRLVPPNDGGLSLGQAVIAGLAAAGASNPSIAATTRRF